MIDNLKVLNLTTLKSNEYYIKLYEFYKSNLFINLVYDYYYQLKLLPDTLLNKYEENRRFVIEQKRFFIDLNQVELISFMNYDYLKDVNILPPSGGMAGIYTVNDNTSEAQS